MRNFAACIVLISAVSAWAQPLENSAEARLFAAIEQGKELVAEGILLQGKPDLEVRNASKRKGWLKRDQVILVK